MTPTGEHPAVQPEGRPLSQSSGITIGLAVIAIGAGLAAGGAHARLAAAETKIQTHIEESSKDRDAASEARFNQNLRIQRVEDKFEVINGKLDDLKTSVTELKGVRTARGGR